ncbi:inactive transglutaminase family protein [Rubritalea marina]|uniref:inactive transglutaminase family protein n=1 Tax=Rubritalea marina TaxID=361055 RepID=UPI0003713F48|nr:inactive transglutaminase family protein [Rubritalea marina]
MKSRVQLRTLIFLLLMVGLGTAFYMHKKIGYPFVPREKVPVWTIEAKVEFDALDEPVKVSLAIPGEQALYGVLDESAASDDYGYNPGLNSKEDVTFRKVVWSKEQAEGKQELYYRVNIFRRTQAVQLMGDVHLNEVDPGYREGPLAVAADQLIAEAQKYSADMETFVAHLNGLFAKKDNQNVQTLLAGNTSALARNRVLLNVALKAGYNAHLIRYLELGETANRVPLQSAVFLHEGEQSILAEFGRVQPIETENLLAWQRGGPALLEVEGGENVRVAFAMRVQQLPATIVQQSAAKNHLASFSLLNLSIEQQNAYGLLLMIPFGALVVVLMRNIIGVKTSGTFMPILLAMAFLKTDLLPGLMLFALVVSVGLIVRSYLSKLDLLLVPRISAVVIVVIGIMVSFGVLGAKFELGIVESVTLFPTIILAWTVERLSILWEEDGPSEVALQTSGSLLVAVIAYWVMGNSTLKYLVFVFPSLLFVVLAVILSLGQYAGYRVSELMRFAPFFDDGNDAGGKV